MAVESTTLAPTLKQMNNTRVIIMGIKAYRLAEMDT